MQPIARLAGMHTCPMTTGPVPHVDGPIGVLGAPTVLARWSAGGAGGWHGDVRGAAGRHHP